MSCEVRSTMAARGGLEVCCFWGSKIGSNLGAKFGTNFEGTHCAFPRRWCQIWCLELAPKVGPHFRAHLSPRSRTKAAPPSGVPHCLVSAQAPCYRVRCVSAVCDFFAPAQLRRPARTVHPAPPVRARGCSRVTLAPVLRAVVGSRVGCACVWPQQSARRRAPGWFVQARRRNVRRANAHAKQRKRSNGW